MLLCSSEQQRKHDWMFLYRVYCQQSEIEDVLLTALTKFH